MRIFHQYGARRTGTNYLRRLLEDNFSNLLVIDRLTWKHSFKATPEHYRNQVFPLYPDTDIVRFKYFLWECDARGEVFEALANAVIFQEVIPLISIKDPYAWIDSMWRWAINSDEQQQPYMFFNTDRYKDRDLKKSYRLRDSEEATIKYAHSFNERYTDWLENNPIVIRYEDLLAEEYRNTVLAGLKNTYGLIGLENFTNHTIGADPIPANLIKDSKMKTDYADYYLKKKYLNNIPPNIQEIITNEIDWELLRPYGYEPIR